MLKVLYAASNNENSKIALSRFIRATEGKPFIIKVAAYKKSSPKHLHIDWTLDCLLNIFNPEHLTLDNDNLSTYFSQIKYFSPDLIITDLEYFTSHIASELNITLWQCSSSAINFALSKKYKYDLGVFSKHAYILNKNPIHTQRIVNIIDNSNCNLIYSHFGDAKFAPILNDNFQWVRPYHSLGKYYVPCQHNLMASLNVNNKKILNDLQNYSDTIVFSDFQDEDYNKIKLKDIDNEKEYFCNLKNCNMLLTEGQASFLADAFYNEKYSIVYPNIQNGESIINSAISQKLGLSKTVYNLSNLNDYLNVSIEASYNNIKYLHEKIEEI